MRRVLIACGGTGGHLSPGVALAEELSSLGWECTLLISNKQVDSRLVKKYGQFAYQCVDGRPFGLRPDRLLLFLVSLLRGTLRCRSLIRQQRPDLVVGFGGFLSLPALLAGKIAGLATAVHEANRVAGRVTRLVSRFVDRVYLPEGVSINAQHSDRIQFLGMPVRNEIVRHPSSEAKQGLGMNPRQKLLLVMGGSQGAASLNEWAGESLAAFAKHEIQVFCLTGGTQADRLETLESPEGLEVRSLFCSFSDEMAMLLSAADLVVSRSGAGSLAEMIRCRVPGILVPYPFSADDHQIANAREFSRLGCGIHYSRDSLDRLLEEVQGVILDDPGLEAFRKNLESADARDVRALMAADLEQIVARNAGQTAKATKGGVAS